MFIVPYLITIIYPWVFKSKKYYWLWCAVLLCIMVWTSEGLSDIENYSQYFDLIGKGDTSIAQIELPILWILINKVFYFFHFSYLGMMLCMIIASFYMIHDFIKTFPIKENIVWSLFLVFPAITQCTQIRFFLATSIVICGMRFLFGETKDVYKYLICVAIGTLIHTATVILAIYGAAVLFKKINRRRMIALTTIGVIALYFNRSLIRFVAEKFVPTMRYQRYFGVASQESDISRLVTVTIIWILSVFIANHIIKDKCFETINGRDPRYNKIQFLINITGLTIPFLLIDTSFHRYFEISYVLFYMVLAQWWTYKKIRKGIKVFDAVIFSAAVFYITRIYIVVDGMLIPLFMFKGFGSLFR